MQMDPFHIPAALIQLYSVLLKCILRPLPTHRVNLCSLQREYELSPHKNAGICLFQNDCYDSQVLSSASLPSPAMRSPPRTTQSRCFMLPRVAESQFLFELSFSVFLRIPQITIFSFPSVLCSFLSLSHSSEYFRNKALLSGRHHLPILHAVYINFASCVT